MLRMGRRLELHPGLGRNVIFLHPPLTLLPLPPIKSAPGYFKCQAHPLHRKLGALLLNKLIYYSSVLRRWPTPFLKYPVRLSKLESLSLTA
jgi:hypothetical protein